MSGSGLAAVHAAASASTALTPATILAQTAPGATAAPPAPAPATTTADLSAAYPDLCAAIRAEGASAERARIIGIEAHAMAGHEGLIAAMKADGTVTPDMAAGRILAAEKAARAGQLQGVQDVEKLTGVVKAAPTASATAQPSAEKASTPEGWEQEYAASPALQAEFPTKADYVAVKKAEAGGRVRVLGARTAG
jgi:hypothetical protein